MSPKRFIISVIAVFAFVFLYDFIVHGLILASLQIATYSYMPISLMLSMSWMVVALFKGIGAGAIIGAV